jgi:hypothetical protein
VTGAISKSAGSDADTRLSEGRSDHRNAGTVSCWATEAFSAIVLLLATGTLAFYQRAKTGK